MAYKFQLGSAILSGSVVAEGTGEFHTEISIGNAQMSEQDLEKLDGITNGTVAANKAVVVDASADASGFRNVTATGAFIIGSANMSESDLEKLDDITDGTVAANKAAVVDANKDIGSFRNVTATRFIGDLTGSVSGGLLQGDSLNVGVSGISTQGNVEGVEGIFTDLSASNTLKVGGTVRLDGVADAAIVANQDSIYFFDVTDNLMKKESMVDFAANLATGFGIKAASGQLALDLNELNGTVQIDPALDSLAFISAANSNGSRKELISDLVSLQAGTGIDGNSGVFSTSAGQTGITSLRNDGLVVGKSSTDDIIDFSPADGLKIETDGTARLTITDALSTVSNNLMVMGNLTVSGTTTTIDSTTINISSSFKFEGPIDDHETILNCGTPVADSEVFLPQLPAGQYHLAALADAPSAASAAVTAAEFAILDGDTTASSFTIADGDQMIINDGGAGGTLKQAAMSSLKTYMTSEAVSKRTAGQTLIVGVNYFDDFGSNGEVAVTLPASSDMVAGQRIKVKAPSDTAANRYLKINTQAGSQKIDGVNSILLESPHAAVELVYVEADKFKVF